MKKSKIIVVVGPTASGKSDLAVKLAKMLNGEVISADSRQVYRKMDIGTGKITKKEMAGIPHYLLDVAPPKKVFNAADFQRLGQKAIKKISAKGKIPIVVGGSGFYIDGLIYGTPLPTVPPDSALRKKLEKLSADKLFAKLKKLDPGRAQNIDRFNKRRLVRALEIIGITGKPVPKIGEQKTNFNVLKIGIKLPDKELKKRVRARLLKRLKQGMTAEVKMLHDKGVSWRRLDNLGLEYRWVSRYLRGAMGKDEMFKKLESEIWRYAKRQMTWFRRDKEINWVTKPPEAKKLVDRFINNSKLALTK